MKKQTLNKQLYELHLISVKHWQTSCNLILDNVNNKLNKELNKHYKNLNNKINNLMENLKDKNKAETNQNKEIFQNKQIFYFRLCNMQQIEFTKEEEALLRYGSKGDIGTSPLKYVKI
jgi:aspartate/tyrosine/aromatic aminotransferase